MPPQIASVDERLRVRSRSDTCESRSNGRSGWGFCGGDRRLAANEEPPLGAHLITPRFAYSHHGVYVGAGTVVHYGAFAYHWHRGPVEEVSLSTFAHGHPVWVRPTGPDALRCEEIVQRARSRLGENRYRLLSNNCEHFSEWCVNGEHRSPQVDRLLAQLCRFSRALSKWMRRLNATPVPRLPALSMASSPACRAPAPPSGHSTRYSAGNSGCRPFSSLSPLKRAPIEVGGRNNCAGPRTRIAC